MYFSGPIIFPGGCLVLALEAPLPTGEMKLMDKDAIGVLFFGLKCVDKSVIGAVDKVIRPPLVISAG